MGNHNNPVFSIIVPVYNVAKYLPQCIESILNQDFQDFELILVDDGSPDNSGEICDYYQQMDARVRVIHKTNGGLVSARIAGIQGSSGGYIFNVDGDDMIEKGILSRVAQIIAQYSPDVISFGYQTIDENLLVSFPHVDPLQDGFHGREKLESIYAKLLYDNNSTNFNACSCIQYSIWSKIFKKSLIYPIQTQIPTDIARGEDVATVMTAICKCNSLYVAHLVGYKYRIQSASMTHTFKPGVFPKLLLLLEYLEQNACCIPPENIRQFAMTEIFYHTKDAVRGFKTYSDYKKYIQEIYTDQILSLVHQFQYGRLVFSRKLQILAIKKKWWMLYWLVYR